MSKPILIGEANPYGGDPDFALYPSPDGCASHRLCVKILGLSRKRYLEAFERTNLCPHKWSIKEARIKAESLRVSGNKLILLGAKVCSAFGMTFTPFTFALTQGTDFGGVGYLILPHPSGLNRMWGAPGTYEKARAKVLEFCPEIFDEADTDTHAARLLHETL